MKVVHCCHEDYDVFIGRPSKWGNPFKIGIHGGREEVIQKYKEWVITQDRLMEELHLLKGKTLGCYCHPLPCHGDVLIQLIKEREFMEI